MPPSVLIVDDHQGFRASAKRLLTSSGFDVIGEAADGAEALSAAAELQPGVVLLDIGLPDADGLDVARSLSETLPGTAIVLISSRPRDEVEPLAAGAPVRGFIPKEELSATSLRELIG